jgi:hypothetical protein
VTSRRRLAPRAARAGSPLLAPIAQNVSLFTTTKPTIKNNFIGVSFN